MSLLVTGSIGLDTIETPAGPQTVYVNPTMYGHGYLLNDLGKDGAVAYHEGMHSISTPIAGLEGAARGQFASAELLRPA